MARILVFSFNPGDLAELAGLARSLGAEAVALVAGEARAAPEPVSRLYIVDAVEPGQMAAAAARLYDEVKPDLVATVSYRNNVAAAALLAGMKGLVMFTDALNVSIEDGVLRARRRVLGGRAEAGYTAKTPAVVAVARGAYEPAQGSRPLEPERLEAPQPRVTLLESKPKPRGSVDLESAEIVIGVGRGFRRKEDLALAEELAKLLGGVVGGSRPIVADYGWLSEDRWIGIGGKKLRAKLYMAIGISGAPQHMAGVMDSKIIVAVNKDKNAPIFQYADYGVVADLYEFLPVLIEKLKKRLGKA